MRYAVVPVKNVARLQEAGRALMERAQGLPGMGLIYGATGFGKTTASYWFVNQSRGVFVRAMALWSPQAMLSAVLTELDSAASGSLANMVGAVVGSLGTSMRPLFIDEADYVVDSQRMTDTLRDIHDYSNVPVILIGMDGIRGKLDKRHRKQTIGRISRWVEFLPCDWSDCKLVSAQLVEHTKVGDDLLQRLHERSGGNMRRLVVGLNTIEAKARRKGLTHIGAEDWGKNEPFFLGSPDDESGR